MMHNQSKRDLILHFAKSGHKPKKIRDHLFETYAQDAPPLATVQNRCNEFKWGRSDTKTRPSSGRPSEIATNYNIQKALTQVRKDPKISCRMLSDVLKIDRKSTKILLRDHLGLEKIAGHWIPHALNLNQKKSRVEICRQLFDRWSHRWSEFKSRLITQDETWLLYEQPDTPNSSAEWLPSGSSGHACPRLSRTNGKLMLICFWDYKGLIYTEFFESTKDKPGLDAKF